MSGAEPSDDALSDSPFSVDFTEDAAEDIARLFDYRLQRAMTADDFDAAQRAIDGIRRACADHLSANPFTYRKCGDSSTRRELVIGFGASGYVAQFEILAASRAVLVLAVRHQLEQDYW